MQAGRLNCKQGERRAFETIGKIISPCTTNAVLGPVPTSTTISFTGCSPALISEISHVASLTNGINVGPKKMLIAFLLTAPSQYKMLCSFFL